MKLFTKCYVIDYALISPSVLAMLVRNSIPEACCFWTDIDEDYFEFNVAPWDNSELDYAKVEKILAPYV